MKNNESAMRAFDISSKQLSQELLTSYSKLNALLKMIDNKIIFTKIVYLHKADQFFLHHPKYKVIFIAKCDYNHKILKQHNSIIYETYCIEELAEKIKSLAYDEN